LGEGVAGGEGGVFTFGGLRRFGDGFSTGAMGISGFEMAVFLFSHNREIVRLNPISITVLITDFLWRLRLIRYRIYFEQSHYA
jgi:hypothetical protein